MTDTLDALRAALMRERAAHGQTREALIEAQARWEAICAAKDALSGGVVPGEARRPLSGQRKAVQ